jgi:hypothetical protein
MVRKNEIVAEYARMWPREVFDCLVPDEDGGRKQKKLVKGLERLDRAGVYVLCRDDVPYYIGQATRLRGRIRAHASVPGATRHNFWNFFSAFVIPDPKQRNEIEGILIAAMPTANSAKPRLRRAKFPLAVRKMTRSIQRYYANPRIEFDRLAREVLKQTRVLVRAERKNH